MNESQIKGVPVPVTIRMPRAHGEAWLAALRSGDYEQGDGFLRTADNRYCCLGVLQMVLDGGVEPGNQADPSRRTPSCYWLRRFNIEFKGATGRSDLIPYLHGISLSASQANDGALDGAQRWNRRPLSFAEIADALEASMEFTDA